jgi:hypothetical protein
LISSSTLSQCPDPARVDTAAGGSPSAEKRSDATPRLVARRSAGSLCAWHWVASARLGRARRWGGLRGAAKLLLCDATGDAHAPPWPLLFSLCNGNLGRLPLPCYLSPAAVPRAPPRPAASLRALPAAVFSSSTREQHRPFAIKERGIANVHRLSPRLQICPAVCLICWRQCLHEQELWERQNCFCLLLLDSALLLNCICITAQPYLPLPPG